MQHGMFTVVLAAKNGHSIPPTADESEHSAAGESEPLKIDSICKALNIFYKKILWPTNK